MSPIKLRPRKPKFRCAFCNKIAGEKAMLKHESICFYNPDRHCDLCNDLGYYGNGYDEPEEPCYYCSQFSRRNADTVTPAPLAQAKALSSGETADLSPRTAKTNVIGEETDAKKP